MASQVSPVIPALTRWVSISNFGWANQMGPPVDQPTPTIDSPTSVHSTAPPIGLPADALICSVYCSGLMTSFLLRKRLGGGGDLQAAVGDREIDFGDAVAARLAQADSDFQHLAHVGAAAAWLYALVEGLDDGLDAATLARAAGHDPVIACVAPERSTVTPLIGCSPFDFVHNDFNPGLGGALYDVMGKHLDVPAYKLMGQKVRDAVAVAAWTAQSPPMDFAGEIARAAAQGYRICKMHTGAFYDVVEQTQAAEEVAPDGFQLHFDFNGYIPCRTVGDDSRVGGPSHRMRGYTHLDVSRLDELARFGVVVHAGYVSQEIAATAKDRPRLVGDPLSTISRMG